MTALSDGHQRANSFIQLASVDLGTSTRWGPPMPRHSLVKPRMLMDCSVLPRPISSARMLQGARTKNKKGGWVGRWVGGWVRAEWEAKGGEGCESASHRPRIVLAWAGSRKDLRLCGERAPTR